MCHRFEAAEPDVFAYHIQNQGARANLFIDHSQIVQLACLRRGIWGTGSTFARVVTFEGAGEHLRKGGRAVHSEPSEKYGTTPEVNEISGSIQHVYH